MFPYRCMNKRSNKYKFGLYRKCPALANYSVACVATPSSPALHCGKSWAI